MRLTLALLAVAFAFSAGAWGDPVLNVTSPKKGEFIYWMEYTDTTGKSQLTVPQSASRESFKIDLAPVAEGENLSEGYLKVLDPRSGNVAPKKLASLEGKTDLKLKEADFTLVRTVSVVLIPSGGEPDERIASAVVTLMDGNSDEYTSIVDPTMEGTAVFHDVAGGAVSVQVGYDDSKKMILDFSIPLDRKTQVYTEELTIPSKAKTVKASTTGPGEAKSSYSSSSDAESKKGSSSVWLQYVISFALLFIVVGVAFAIWKSMGARSLEESLRKMGVQFPQDAEGAGAPATDAGPQVDPNICQFCGQHKDANGACACSVDAPLSGATPTPSTGALGVPRLVGTLGTYSGRIFEIAGAEATIGRDTGNTIPLPDDHTTSRRHARIVNENGVLSIVDEGSSNGTFVNGGKIAGKHALSAGDEIQLGSTKFRFEM